MDDRNLRNFLYTAIHLLRKRSLFNIRTRAGAYEAGGVFLRIDGYSQLFMMLEITMQGVFYGIGRTVPPAIISIGCNYMRIPLAILFVRMGMGVEGIWWAVSVTTVAKGLILLSWFIIIRKKCLNLPSVVGK